MFKGILNILLFFACLELISGVWLSILSFRYTTIVEEATVCRKALNQSELKINQWKVENSLNADEKECSWLVSQSKADNLGIYLSSLGKLYIQKGSFSLNIQDLIYVNNLIIAVVSFIYAVIYFCFHINISNTIIISLGIVWTIFNGLLSLKLNLFFGMLEILIVLIIIIVIEYVLLSLKKNETVNNT